MIDPLASEAMADSSSHDFHTGFVTPEQLQQAIKDLSGTQTEKWLRELAREISVGGAEGVAGAVDADGFVESPAGKRKGGKAARKVSVCGRVCVCVGGRLCIHRSIAVRLVSIASLCMCMCLQLGVFILSRAHTQRHALRHAYEHTAQNKHIILHARHVHAHIRTQRDARARAHTHERTAQNEHNSILTPQRSRTISYYTAKRQRPGTGALCRDCGSGCEEGGCVRTRHGFRGVGSDSVCEIPLLPFSILPSQFC